jgi:tetratricopeptide (TPR) repeat protein
VLSFLWTPHLGSLLSSPLTNIFDGGNIPLEPRPAYSIAMARQKQGHYLEAVAEIRRQLARFPTDLEGHLLLAGILAEHLGDLPGAENTIEHFVTQTGHAPKNIAFALYSLADWHLRFGQDREAARRALQRIIDLLPDSEYALGAAQRLGHLGSAEMLLSSHDRKKFAVPEGVKNLGLLLAREHPAVVETDPGEAAAAYVRHLEHHPLDMEAREKLAVLYAGHFKRLDLAASELEQMIAQPNQTPKLVVHWLNLLADLQIRAGGDYEMVSQTLQRIIERFPNLAAAEMARNRLAILKLELKANTKTEGVKLGSYEQRLGLKNHAGPWPKDPGR